MSDIVRVIKSAVEGNVAVFYPCECEGHESGYEHFVDQLARSIQSSWALEQAVAAVQAALVTAMNALGAVLVGSGFETVESSPIPDEEMAAIILSAMDAAAPEAPK